MMQYNINGKNQQMYCQPAGSFKGTESQLIIELLCFIVYQFPLVPLRNA